MKPVRFTATILFYVTRLTGTLYFLTALHISTALLFKTSSLLVEAGGRFKINFPFTKQGFIIGDAYEPFYITELIGFMFLYGIFFWLLSNVFSAFRQQRLFTVQNVRKLTWFYLANLLVPFPVLIIHIILSYEVETLLGLMVAHAVLGVFAFFMTAIFKQGVHLQNEQDLYI